MIMQQDGIKFQILDGRVSVRSVTDSVKDIVIPASIEYDGETLLFLTSRNNYEQLIFPVVNLLCKVSTA